MTTMITPNYNSYNRYGQYNKQNKPAFTANPNKVAEEVLTSATNKSSKFFEPINNAYDKMTDVIADKFTSRLVNWKPLNYLADKFKDSNNLFKHCLTVGSVITSGLYMQRTLANKDFDKDRKYTLAVNQGLTLVASTIGAYALDSYLTGWWDNVTARYAGLLLGDDKFYSKYLQDKEAIKKENIALKAKGAELKSMPKITSLVEKHANYKVLLKDDATLLMRKVKGMGPLKSILVFGFVYRYFVPVAVTKPTNKLCEMYLKHKKEKGQQEVNKA